MLRFIIRRISVSIFIALGVLSLTFLIIHLAPGDPSSIYIRPEIDPETVANIRTQMGLDKPILKQFMLWIREIITGNFGISFSHMRPVGSILWEATLNTLQLTILVFFFQLFSGILIGVISAVNKNTKLDFGLNSALLFLYSIPGFWLALMAILIFCLKLGWLPSSQMKSLITPVGILPQLFDRLKHLILPVVILSTPFIAYTARFVRGSLIETLNQDYIRTAKAYGITKNKIVLNYALKNTLLPLITLFGLYLPFILGGSVITENIFAWPGVGRITVNAIFAHDFPLILATNFIAALTVIVGNLISDISYTIADPRIRLEGFG